ncbi:hypothetical protein M5K25_002575 [Dendrobium thyrsiflorum]|uniref:Uncharacterized protein n=1 Tax=Dendrobium thyrsiflorum TaxID=117978 RepID=A0ABD0VVH6_DENTH
MCLHISILLSKAKEFVAPYQLPSVILDVEEQKLFNYELGAKVLSRSRNSTNPAASGHQLDDDG